MDQFRDREGRQRSTADDRLQREKTDELLRNLGADDVIIETITYRIDDEEVQSVVKKLRVFAQENPAVVLGALSALIAGGAVAAGTAVARKNAKKSAKKGARKSAKKSAKSRTRPAAAKKTRAASSKRTLIEPHPGDKRYVRRDAKGRIKESVDVGRSLAADRRRKSKTRAKAGSGDKGDR